MTDGQKFRTWLRAARTSADLSQQKLADAMHRDGFAFRQTTIAKIESGDRPISLDEAAAITRMFGTTLDVALGLKPDHPSSLASQQLAARTSLLSQIRAMVDDELSGSLGSAGDDA